jgi:hypothetical protein
MNFIFIICGVALGSILAFTGILAYGKTKKLPHLFFVASSFFIYIDVIFRTLAELHIFILSEYSYQNVPIFSYIINYSYIFFMIIGFILLLKDE